MVVTLLSPTGCLLREKGARVLIAMQLQWYSSFNMSGNQLVKAVRTQRKILALLDTPVVLGLV